MTLHLVNLCRVIPRRVAWKSEIARVLADLQLELELTGLLGLLRQEPQHQPQQLVKQVPEILTFPQVRKVTQL